MLKLFHSPNACSLAPHIALEEAGVPYEPVRVDLRRGEQNRPEYLAINPKGRVPALAGDRGVLTENPAILAFIAHCWPEAKLAPVADAWAMGQVNSFNGFLSSSVHPAFAHAFRPERYGAGEDAAQAMKARAPEAVAEYFRLIEDELSEEGWVHGAAYTISDPYLLVFTRWGLRGFLDMGPFPKMVDHAHRMLQRQAVQTVFAREGITLE